MRNGTGAVEISKGIYWVGGNLVENLQCNPYLIVDGDEAVLIDPGSVLDFEAVYENVCSVVPLEKIKYVILHHQDPDFCASVPLFEAKGGCFQIVTHWRTSTLLVYYGIKSDFYIVNKNRFMLTLASGRVLEFVQTPYLHFAGSIATYDRQSGTFFSSDLFGAFSKSWSLYAGDDYIEGMKAFHEHYMPSNRILRPVMSMLMEMEIHMIAPQHGSIINRDVKKYIRILRDLDCGSLLDPIKKELTVTGGYHPICSAILIRYASIYSREEVQEITGELEMKVNEKLEVIDSSNTGDVLLNRIFEKVLAKKGLSWLIVIEPYMQALAKEYDIQMPPVFDSNFKATEQKLENLNKENQLLKEVNDRLQGSLHEAEDKLTRCPVTKFYNFEFLKKYLTHEIRDLILQESLQNPGLMIIRVDNISKISYEYGESEVEQVYRNFAYMIEEMQNDLTTDFRLQDGSFALYTPQSKKESSLRFAEQIRNAVASSEKFIEKITVSIGVVCFDEMREEIKYANNPEALFFREAVARVRQAEILGQNIVCGHKADASLITKGVNILLVDEDTVVMDVIKNQLENMGYGVYTANDGSEAVDLASKKNVDLIISEIMLPKMDGLLVRENLLAQSHTKNIPYVIVSHLKSEDTVRRAFELEVSHYLKKPFMVTELMGIVKRTIARER